MNIDNVKGTFRVYFNRHGAEPLMWCVAPDGEVAGWEIAVRGVEIEAKCETVYAKKSTPDEDDGRPSAWIRTTGVLSVNLGGATIREA
jgi:hypothetical protein